MQQRFAEFLVFGGPEGPMTQTEAALAAGYSPKRARQEGSELCNPRLSPLVVKFNEVLILLACFVVSILLLNDKDCILRFWFRVFK